MKFIKVLGFAFVLILLSACVTDSMLEQELSHLQEVGESIESAMQKELKPELKKLLKEKLKHIKALQKKLQAEIKWIREKELGILDMDKSLKVLKEMRILVEKEQALDEKIIKTLAKEHKQKEQQREEKLKQLFGIALNNALDEKNAALTLAMKENETKTQEQIQKIKQMLEQMQHQKLGIEKEKEYKRALNLALEQNKIKYLKAQIEEMLQQKEAQMQKLKGNK
ncbi:hypothetical protein OQH61_05180 [Helicobacter sp. MIT 21-1697]|uniref:hypothetical protein n=1 Tax=Helicobacter sp. MIT 21-1697 TaxID=2993733 RepID=UPI00224AF2ED|nr:hypothetical protein [Helicobacter sp. MIT 21-1697]MCX2717125.1 hypothetical protein [Helicobacter sp. MIT 21-1697]